MRKSLFIIFIVSLSNLCAQVLQKEGSRVIDGSAGSEYERTSVTFLYLSFNEERFNRRNLSTFPVLHVNDKFNDHNLKQINSINSPFMRLETDVDRKTLILQELNKNKIGNQIIAKWFNQQPDGTFNMDLIKERGAYNATDADVIKAKNSKRGLTILQDAGESLLKKSYIIVFDYLNTETWDEYYNRLDERLYAYAVATKTTPQKTPRVYEGYRSSVYGYLYRVNWNDSISSVFYNNAYNNPEFFTEMNIPIQYVNEFMIDGIRGQQLRGLPQFTDNELYQMMLQDGLEAYLIEVAREYEEFRVRAPLYSVKPLRAKVGLKEDVKIDQRFFVYEMQLDAQGNKKGIRKGVIRATNKITDNRQMATGEMIPTEFYQESGKKLYPGMLLDQGYDFGLSISAGWALRSLQGPMLQVSYNLSGIFRWTLFRIFIDAQAGGGSASYGVKTVSSYNLGSYSLQIGFSKEYCLTRNIHIEPYAALQWDSLFANGLNKGDKQILDSAGIRYGKQTYGGVIGLRIPINIFHNLQLIPSVSLSTIMYSSNNTIFGSKFPDIKRNPKVYNDNSHLLGSTVGDLRNSDNSAANIAPSPIRWEITLRYKF
ncbi:MAG: hypothetical protein SFY32_13160 [Bacteroidota bacterium]|nr:hypothetical protein [Bacteroidota bacterium]